MKKRLQSRHILPTIILSGTVCYLLRLWLLTAGIDQKGLLRTDTFAYSFTFVLTGAVLLAMLYCLRFVPKRRPAPIFPANSKLSALGCLVAAAGILYTELPGFSWAADRIALLCDLFALLACGSFLCLAWFAFKKRLPHPLFHGAVTVYFMIHVIFQYRNWSAETQVQTYFFPLLASICLMLATYYQACADAHMGQLRQHLLFRYSALYFCITAIAGDSPVFYLSMAIGLAATSFTVPYGKKRKEMHLPENVRLCLDTLNKGGYEAYVVGGCVRDSLLGIAPQDYDMCTNAKPEEIAECFAGYQLIRNGEKHGTIGVVIDKEVFEITTFRTEGSYTDNRHPDWVEFVSRLEDDLARRDFTVNAMAYSPQRGYVDPWDGQKDLRDKILRTVGDPTTRFTEDALRILRGVRFAVRFDLLPDPATESAMFAMAPTMEKLAKERIFSELCKLLPLVTAHDLLRYRPVLTQVIPELAPMVDFNQKNPHHQYDVYTHVAHTVAAVPGELPLRLAALLHDIGKPVTFTLDEKGCGHFYEHASVGAKMADKILLRLRASNELRQQVVTLIEYHMIDFSTERTLLKRRLSKFGADTVRQLLILQQADFQSKGTIADDNPDFGAIHATLDSILEGENCLTVRDLAISGNDLLNAGFTPGPQIGKVLNLLLEAVLTEQIPNGKEALLAAAEGYIQGEEL